jgi:hypothetical protein
VSQVLENLCSDSVEKEERIDFSAMYAVGLDTVKKSRSSWIRIILILLQLGTCLYPRGATPTA